MKPKKIFVILLSLVATFALCFALTACDDTPDEVTHEGYKLSYAKGAYAATGEVADSWHKEGEEVTLADGSVFALNGHVIDKWSDGTDEYEPGSTFTMPAHDVKLTAKWKQGDPNAPVVTAGSVGFDDGYFVFTGTIQNVNSLYVYLNNTNVSASNSNYVQAQISGNTFTARLPLSTLAGYNQANIPFNLRYKIDSTTSEILGVSKGSLDLSATCKYGENNYRLDVNTGSNCVAVYYAPAPDTSVTVTATSIAFDEGYFVVNGTVANVNNLYIYLINTYHAETLDNYVEAEISGNTFTARLSLTQLVDKGGVTNDPFNLRYRVNESSTNVNIPQGTLDIMQTHTYGGNDFRLGINNGCVAVYYSPTPQPEEPDYSLSVSNMYFSDGKFIVEGKCGAQVEKIVIHLNKADENPVFDLMFEATITDGEFKVEIALADIKKADDTNPPTSYINVRYERNNEGFSTGNNFVPGKNGNADYAVDVTSKYEGKIWTLKADANRTYLAWEAVPVTPEPGEPDYSMSVSSMRFFNGKFIVEGTCGADVSELIFHFNNAAVSPKVDVTATAEIDSENFTAEVLLSDLNISSGSYINVRYEKNGDNNGGSYYNLLPTKGGDYFVGASCKDGDKIWKLMADDNRTYLVWSAAPSVEENSIVIYTMYFGNGKFIVEGECGSGINELKFHLNNTNSPKIDCAFDAVITDGMFKVEISLSDIKNVNDAVPGAGTYINVRYEKNGDKNNGSYYNLLPSRDGGYATGATYTYEDKTWTLSADSSRTYIKWAAAE